MTISSTMKTFAAALLCVLLAECATDKVAAVEIGTPRGGPGTAATVVAFEVPPAGWSMP